MQKQYADQGLSVLGFPSRDFGNQEATSNPEIKGMCDKFGVEFDMFEPSFVHMGDVEAEIGKDQDVDILDDDFDGERGSMGLWRWLQSQDNPATQKYHAEAPPRRYEEPHMARWNFDGNYVIGRDGKLAGAYTLNDQKLGGKIERKIKEELAKDEPREEL